MIQLPVELSYNLLQYKMFIKYQHFSPECNCLLIYLLVIRSWFISMSFSVILSANRFTNFLSSTISFLSSPLLLLSLDRQQLFSSINSRTCNLRLLIILSFSQTAYCLLVVIKLSCSLSFDISNSQLPSWQVQVWYCGWYYPITALSIHDSVFFSIFFMIICFSSTRLLRYFISESSCSVRSIWYSVLRLSVLISAVN